MDSPIQRAKTLLPIPILWQRLGLPGKPRRSCRSPFRPDRSPSFSVYDGGQHWRDFGTGDHGDAVDFLARAAGCDQHEAARRLIALAGTAPVPRPAAEPRRRLCLPEVTGGSPDQHRQLAELRGISVEGVSLAARRGLLRFGEWKGRTAWFVLDATRRNAQARRMDGNPWPEIGDKKAFTLPGSQAAWPLGIGEARQSASVALVEGGPDLLAAFHFCWCENRAAGCAPVAMLGASLSIHPDALPVFTAKRIRVFAHDDPAGQVALCRWADQLRRVGATVDAFRFTGLRRCDDKPASDLNDLAAIHPHDFEHKRALWSLLP